MTVALSSKHVTRWCQEVVMDLCMTFLCQKFAARIVLDSPAVVTKHGHVTTGVNKWSDCSNYWI
jgi:hypothetical protein